MERGLKPRNLNLPPYPSGSHWAGDYPGEFESLWKDPSESRYLFTGRDRFSDQDRPINELFYKFLTKMRRPSGALNKRCELEKNRAGWPLAHWPRVLNAVTRLLYPAFRIQPRSQDKSFP